MNKYFEGVNTVEELRKQYRELLKKFHPDNLTPMTIKPKMKRLKRS